MEVTMNDDCEISDEEYIVSMAKRSLHADPLDSKAWMLTAKTLFPKKFGIQYEAYEIEKLSNNCKEAAKYFSDLICQWPNDEKLWQEVHAMMFALRSKTPDDGQIFLQNMFSHIPSEIQYELLLVTADRSEDTIDHCHLMLLLLKKFPNTIEQHGAKLVDTLMAAEKHSHDKNPVNSFRKLLVCELQPLLGTCPTVILPSKQLFNLLHKSVEFYLCYILNMYNNNVQDLPGTEGVLEDPWKNLFIVYQTIAKKLKWELSDIITYPLKKRQAFKKIALCLSKGVTYYQQIVYCTMPLFISLLYDYNVNLDPGAAALRGQSESSLVMIESPAPTSILHPTIKSERYNDLVKLDGAPTIKSEPFNDLVMLKDTPTSTLHAKIKSEPYNDVVMSEGPSTGTLHTTIKSEPYNEVVMSEGPSTGTIKSEPYNDVVMSESASTGTIKSEPFASSNDEFLESLFDRKIHILDRGNNNNLTVVDNFLLAFKCYGILHTEGELEREFSRLCHLYKLEPLLKEFYIDMTLYEGHYFECSNMLAEAEPNLKRSLRLACTYFFQNNYEEMQKEIASAVSQVLSMSSGVFISTPPGGDIPGRRISFIPLKKLPVLQYCCKLMISALKKCFNHNCMGIDLACGHILVLCQLDWPMEEKLFIEIIKKIKQRGCWSYSLFMKYIVNIDYLEEFMYLSTDHGGGLSLDILVPSSSQILNHRRMSTRGVDKGAKEDFKMSMRRQVSRSQEPIDSLIAKFLTTEKDIINHAHFKHEI